MRPSCWRAAQREAAGPVRRERGAAERACTHPLVGAYLHASLTRPSIAALTRSCLLALSLRSPCAAPRLAGSWRRILAAYLVCATGPSEGGFRGCGRVRCRDSCGQGGGGGEAARGRGPRRQAGHRRRHGGRGARRARSQRGGAGEAGERGARQAHAAATVRRDAPRAHGRGSRAAW